MASKPTPPPGFLLEDDAAPSPPAGFVMESDKPSSNGLQDLKRQGLLTARYLIEGPASLPMMIGDSVNSILNAGVRGVNNLAGTNIPQFPPASASLQSLLNQSGLPRPETPQEDLVAAGGRALAGTGGFVKAGQMLSNVPSAAHVGEVLKAKPGLQAIGSLLGSGTSEYMRQNDFGPGAQLAGGLAAGLLGPAAVDVSANGLMGAARAVPALVKPFTQSGKEEIAGRTLNTLATDQTSALARIQGAAETVPGSIPTTAQSSRDYGLLTAERGMASLSPSVGGRFAERFAKQNQARRMLLDSMAQDGKAVESAKVARDTTSLPFLETAKQGGAKVDVSPVVEKIDNILSGESGERDLVVNVLNSVKSKLYNGNGGLKDDITRLYGIRKHIGDLLDNRLSGVAKNAQIASRELLQIRTTLDEQIAKVSPEFSNYLSTYKGMSQPVNQMEMLQDMSRSAVNTGTSATGERLLSQAKWTRLYDNNKEALAKTLSPAQMRNIERITQDLDTGALSVSGGRAAGSNTFQNLSTANLIVSMIGANKNPDSTLFRTLSRPLAFIYKVPDQDIQALMVDAMLDPKLAAWLMSKATKGNVTSVSAALQQRLNAAGMTGANVSSQEGQRRQAGRSIQQ